jgi:metal-dependent amidase/aminoacylase/carboxypeptidase family protein
MKMDKNINFLFLSLVFFIYLTGCEQTGKQESAIKLLQNDIDFLASDQLEGRETGTEGAVQTAKFLAKRFEEIGLEPKGTDGYFQEFSFSPRNVIGFIDNKAPNTIILGAHFDHLGYGDENSLYKGDSSIHNGADDNASGVAAMLLLAEELSERNINNNYLFIGFSGEEKGLFGSNYYSKNPTIDLEKVNYLHHGMK